MRLTANAKSEVMLRNYLLILFRSFKRNKVFMLVNVLGMGIAIACCIIAYFNWDFNENFDRNHVNAPSIYRVQAWQVYQGQRNRYAVVPNPLGEIVRQNFADVEEVVRYTTAKSDIRIGDEVFNTSVSYADAAFFELFTFTLKAGTFSEFSNRTRIFISDVLARTYFDSEDIVGKTITQINEGELKEFTIGGVFEQQPVNSSFAFDAITLLDNYQDVVPDRVSPDNDWKSMSTLFLRITDRSRVGVVTKQLQSYIAPQNQAREDLQFSEYYLQNFATLAANFYGHTWLNGEQLRWGTPPSAVFGPGIMAVFLLLLACFNFTNTSVAVSGGRLKEIGIRKSMGSRRSQLIAQFLGESIILCALALLLGLLLAELLVPAYNSMWPGIKLSITFGDNVSFLLYLAALLLFTAVIAGIYPAFYITSFEPVTILKGKLKFGGTNWFTRTLLTFQFVISLLCVIVAVAYTRNADYQRDFDLGYARSGVITAKVKDKREFDAYRNLLASNKDIISIAGSKNHVSDNYYKGPVVFEGTEHQVEVVDIGDDYLETMRVGIIDGRGFEKDSENDKRGSILVSEQFVKQFNWTDGAIGKRVVWADSIPLYVVGVVKNIHTDGFWKPVAPVMLRYIGPEQYKQIVVSTAPENLLNVNDFMKETWKKVSPNTMYSGQYYDGNIDISNMINSNVLRIFGFLGIVAVLMSATGLFAMVSLNILKRMKEIGVRKVLGASAVQIAGVINFEFIIILSIASLLGGALGYVATDKLMDAVWEYYLRINTLTLAVSVLVLFVAAIGAVGYKTVTTALINPVKVLRDL